MAGPACDPVTSSQNSRRRATPDSGGLPAIRAALIAPIEMPATHCGACPAPVIASKTPAW
jgi:hypothetical protein